MERYTDGLRNVTPKKLQYAVKGSTSARGRSSDSLVERVVSTRRGTLPISSVGRLLWARAKPWGLYAPLQGCLGHCGAAPQAGLRPPIAVAFRCDPPILARPTSSLSPCPCTSPVWSTPCSRPHVLRLHPTTLVRRVGWSSRVTAVCPGVSCSPSFRTGSSTVLATAPPVYRLYLTLC